MRSVPPLDDAGNHRVAEPYSHRPQRVLEIRSRQWIWEIQAYVRNVFDKQVLAYAIQNPLANTNGYQLQPPRTYVVRGTFTLCDQAIGWRALRAENKSALRAANSAGRTGFANRPRPDEGSSGRNIWKQHLTIVRQDPPFGNRPRLCQIVNVSSFGFDAPKPPVSKPQSQSFGYDRATLVSKQLPTIKLCQIESRTDRRDEYISLLHGPCCIFVADGVTGVIGEESKPFDFIERSPQFSGNMPAQH